MSRINLRTEIEFSRKLLESKMPNFDFGCTDEVIGSILVDLVEVPASSTNLSLSVSTISNVKRVFLVDIDSSEDLTIKVNGDSVAFPLKNFFKMSENLTELSATNASSTLDQKIMIIYITEV